MMKAIMRDEREMKNSGIEWIGKIPEGWQVQKCKYVMDFINGYAFQSDDFTNYGEYDVIRIGDIVDGEVNFDSCTKVNNNCDIENYLIKEEDLLIAMSGATVGKIAYVHDNRIAYINQRVGIMRTNSINARFLFYCFNTPKFIEYVNLQSPGSAQPNISMYVMNNFYIPKIDFCCQVAIANYLDDRCSKIDAIIAEAKASIEEYKELKISMVNDAITHGINGIAISDSGVDWIGKIPSNWQIMILKRLFRIKKDIARKEGYTVLSITQRGIVPKNFKESGQFAADYSNYQLVDKGDFAMNHMDLLTGWVDISEYDGVTSPDYRVFIPTGYEEVYKPYYKYVLQNCYSCKIFYGLGHGVAGFGRWRLPKDMFLNFKVPLPPIDEQKEIASYLDDNLQKLNDLILTKQSLIEELENYKKSLIYEVVTGKRKVVE